LSHARNRHSILWLELLVLRLFLHVYTLRYEVLHFRFEAAKALHMKQDFNLDQAALAEFMKRFHIGDSAKAAEELALEAAAKANMKISLAPVNDKA
jgi:hypothetical protein